jgi:hypothetical protein
MFARNETSYIKKKNNTVSVHSELRYDLIRDPILLTPNPQVFFRNGTS